MRLAICLIIAIFASLGLVASSDAARGRRDLRELSERAKAGDAKAIYRLALVYDVGYDSIPIDSAKSTALYRLAAEKGYAPAQNYLGFRYYRGEYVKRDVDSALYWLAKAAGGGDAKAANNLGFLLMEGKDVKRDYHQALKWLTMAAESGLPTGQSQLADMHRRGLATVPDTLRAIELYTKALEQGLADAEIKLLNMMGRKWESLPTDSLLALGRRYYTHRAPMIGASMFKTAAGRGSAEAFTLLGDAYSRGNGVDYDHDRSVACYLEGAMRGNPSAQFVVAELLEIFPDALSGDGISGILHDYYGKAGLPRDIDKAAYWYEKAAAQGVADAAEATRRLFP